MRQICLIALLSAGCSLRLGGPPPRHCYIPERGFQKRCFYSEEEMRADVRRIQHGVMLRRMDRDARAAEERAKRRALEEIAEQDAKDAAARAKVDADRADHTQDEAFDLLVEMQLEAQERARATATPSESPPPAPQTPPAP